MDLKAYYQKIRDVETKIVDEFPVLIGIANPRISTEVTRSIAARMLADGTAREASADEAKAFRKAQADARRAAEEAEAAKTVQFRVVSVDDVRKLTKDRA